MSSETTINNEKASAAIASMKRAPWDVLSSVELADLLGVSLQVLANWRVRGSGPAPAPSKCFRGNRTYYPIFSVISWMKGGENWHAVRDWLHEKYIFPKPLTTEEATWAVVRQHLRLKICPLHHKPRIPLPLEDLAMVK